MSSFSCPHNKDVHIEGACPIKECPYHMDNIDKLFSDIERSTNCSYYDSDLMQNISSRTQISALSRDARRKINPRTMRALYENSLQYAGTLHAFTHEVPQMQTHCAVCGYPGRLQCVSSELCGSRNEWVLYVCSLYKIEPIQMKKQLIWELLFHGRINLEKTSLSIGISLCSNKDLQKYEKLQHPDKEPLEEP